MAMMGWGEVGACNDVPTHLLFRLLFTEVTLMDPPLQLQ